MHAIRSLNPLCEFSKLRRSIKPLLWGIFSLFFFRSMRAPERTSVAQSLLKFFIEYGEKLRGITINNSKGVVMASRTSSSHTKSHTSKRGFAAMDPEEQREIASMGGHASHGGRGRDYESDDDDSPSRRHSDRDDDDSHSSRSGSSRRGYSMDSEERGSHGGRSRDYDSDDDHSYRSRRRYSDDDDTNERSGSRPNGRQGFASMDPDEQREIASMGGRASHGGRGRDYDDDDTSGRSSRRRDDDDYEDRRYSSSRSGTSRRGFASMDPEEQREIASMGGRASHGGGRGRSRDDEDDDNSSRSGRRSSSRH